jgi:hypothetical protein
MNPETFTHIVLEFLMRQSKAKAGDVAEGD